MVSSLCTREQALRTKRVTRTSSPRGCPARLQRLNAQVASLGYSITHGKAVEIAKANGIASIREVDLEDNAEWKVEGRDAQGRELEVELSARDGAVRKVERD